MGSGKRATQGRLWVAPGVLNRMQVLIACKSPLAIAHSSYLEVVQASHMGHRSHASRC